MTTIPTEYAAILADRHTRLTTVLTLLARYGSDGYDGDELELPTQAERDEDIRLAQAIVDYSGGDAVTALLDFVGEIAYVIGEDRIPALVAAAQRDVDAWFDKRLRGTWDNEDDEGDDA